MSTRVTWAARSNERTSADRDEEARRRDAALARQRAARKAFEQAHAMRVPVVSQPAVPPAAHALAIEHGLVAQPSPKKLPEGLDMVVRQALDHELSPGRGDVRDATFDPDPPAADATAREESPTPSDHAPLDAMEDEVCAQPPREPVDDDPWPPPELDGEPDDDVLVMRDSRQPSIEDEALLSPQRLAARRAFIEGFRAGMDDIFDEAEGVLPHDGEMPRSDSQPLVRPGDRRVAATAEPQQDIGVDLPQELSVREDASPDSRLEAVVTMATDALLQGAACPAVLEWLTTQLAQSPSPTRGPQQDALAVRVEHHLHEPAPARAIREVRAALTRAHEALPPNDERKERLRKLLGEMESAGDAAAVAASELAAQQATASSQASRLAETTLPLEVLKAV